MSKIKYFIMFLIIIVIVLTVFLSIHIKSKGKEDVVFLKDIKEPNSLNSIGYTDFFTVSNCIAQYLDVIDRSNSSYYGMDENGKQVLVVTSKQVAENILGLLSDNYKKEKEINNSNIASKIKMLNEKNILTLTKVTKINEGNVFSYVAQGFTVNMDNKFLKDIYFIVNLDSFNKTFSIEELDDNVDMENIKRDAIEKIDKNLYNSYTPYVVKEEDTINKHVVAFKRMMLAKPELAYEYLDEEYRNKRFGNYDNFAKYINQFKTEIISLNMKKFKVNSYDDYKEYIIIDDNGKYYRFRENNVMDYTVMFDVYTIDLPEYKEQFNLGNEQTKVGLCIERFLQMINAQNYEAAYNLLDETFKQNNFKTLDEFKQYIQENFHYSNNLKTIDKFSKEGIYYICTVSIENAKFLLNEPIQRSFVVQIGEGTDFKMSFDME